MTAHGLSQRVADEGGQRRSVAGCVHGGQQLFGDVAAGDCLGGPIQPPPATASSTAPAAAAQVQMAVYVFSTVSLKLRFFAPICRR